MFTAISNKLQESLNKFTHLKMIIILDDVIIYVNLVLVNIY